MLSFLLTTAPMALAQEEPAPAAEPATAGNAMDAQSEAAADPAKEEGKLPVSGYFSNRYRARWTGANNDHDYYGVLSLNYGDPWKERVTAHAMGRFSADLDGNQDTIGYYVFDNVVDVKDRWADARLYYLYADVNRVGPIERIRLGRQIDHTTPEIAYFDGGEVETKSFTPVKLSLGGYAGAPVRIYDDFFTDGLIAGTWAQIRPWRMTRVRADWMHVSDDYFGSRAHNDLLGVAAWQNMQVDDDNLVILHGRYTALEGKNRDVRGQLTFRNSKWDLLLAGSYYGLLEKQQQLTIEFDPFYTTLFTLAPYHEATGRLSKGFYDVFMLDAGLQIRVLQDEADAGQYNREFNRYYVTGTIMKLFMEGLSLSGTLEMWHSHTLGEADRNIVTGGGEIAYKHGRTFQASAGTSYALYKYDFYTNFERDDVRTYFARVKYRFAKRYLIELKYELETHDYDYAIDYYDRYNEFTGRFVMEL